MNRNTGDPTLWSRIDAFEFDQGRPVLTFARRLARENGWSAAHADRVLREYKRFAYLAVAAGHPVTPSPEVDQAWHLHLTYTRSYWSRFCGETLGQPLHHEPTRGGGDEAAKHACQYAATLESYERHFGESPPADVWPPVEFTASHERWVDTSRYWLVPRPRLSKASSIAVTAMILPVAAVWNPFDFDGPTFLIFYVVVAGATLVAALLMRFLSSDGSDSPDQEPYDLRDPYEVACLANGSSGVIQSVLTAFVQRGNLRLENDRISRGDPLPAGAPPIERALYDALPETGDKPLGEFKEAARTARPFVVEYRDRLRAGGLLTPHPAEPFTRHRLPFLLMLGVTALGVVKIGVGLSRDKPIVWLFLLTAVCAVAVKLFVSRGRLTARGKDAVNRLKTEHERLTVGSVDAMSPLDAALLVGLFGTTCLAGTGLSTLHDARRQWEGSAGADGGCGTGCGDGGGDGCGGGGCGGCGGE